MHHLFGGAGGEVYATHHDIKQKCQVQFVKKWHNLTTHAQKLTDWSCRGKKHTLKQRDDGLWAKLTIPTLLLCRFRKTDESSERKWKKETNFTLVSHLWFTSGGAGDNVGQSRTDHLIADIHVLLAAIFGSVDFGLCGPRCAVTFYRARRQSRVVRILPVLPFLFAVVALLFFVIVPGDLGKENNVWDMRRPLRTGLPQTTKASCVSEVCRVYDTNLDVSFLSIWFSLPLFVFAFLFLAAGAFMFLSTELFFTLALPLPFLILFLFLLVSVEDGEEQPGVIKCPCVSTQRIFSLVGLNPKKTTHCCL